MRTLGLRRPRCAGAGTRKFTKHRLVVQDTGRNTVEAHVARERITAVQVTTMRDHFDHGRLESAEAPFRTRGVGHEEQSSSRLARR